MAEFYKHSGAVSVGGLIGGVVLGVGVAAGLSAVYAYGVNWIPFIYINFLLTAGFGLAIGGAVFLAARMGKVRNNGVVAAIGLLCGLVGVYYAWAFDMVARRGASFTMDPLTIWDYVLAFNEQGDWSIRRHAKENVTGIFLWIVWAVEAGVIVAAATYMPWFLMSESVFCETCDVWTKNEEGVRRLAPELVEQVTASVLAGNVAVLRMVPLAASDKECVRLDLNSCEHCGDSNYLTVTSVVTSTNKKGEENTETKELVKYLRISEADVAHVREAGVPAEMPPPPEATA